MGIRHVREMNIGNAVDCRRGSCALDSEIIQSDPGQLHRLHRDEQRHHRYAGKPALDEQRGCSMVNGKHGVSPLRLFDVVT